MVKLSQLKTELKTIAAFVAPSSTSNPTNTKFATKATTWYAKRAYAHFATEAYGVNG